MDLAITLMSVRNVNARLACITDVLLECKEGQIIPRSIAWNGGQKAFFELVRLSLEEATDIATGLYFDIVNEKDMSLVYAFDSIKKNIQLLWEEAIYNNDTLEPITYIFSLYLHKLSAMSHDIHGQEEKTDDNS